MITIKEILRLKSKILDTSKVKLIRHKDNRIEYREVIKDREALLKYQSHQSEDVFGKCDYIVSFTGLENSKSLFFGVFKVNNVEKVSDGYLYDLTVQPEFEDFVDRVVINWGKSTISWHQWFDKQDKEVIEILPEGYLGHFPGLTNFVLDFNELKKLIDNPEANKEWKNHLSSINGIYMILDTKTGNQYIGSAYGKDGIWQRWKDYATTKSGGNKLLKKLINSDKDYHLNFQYTIIQSLPSNLNKKEVIQIENLYKKKFGTKTHGLNLN